jgi:UDP-GlcNAc:undecaprenyl-phosphate GlcNAc-1-phosphate transferase
MFQLLILGLAVLALLITGFATPLVIRLCRRYNALDKPGERKIHSRGVPRLGGVAIFIALSLGMSIAVWGIVSQQLDLPPEQLALLPLIYAGLVGFFVIGFIDDIRSLPALPRLLAQLATATAVVLLSDGAIRINSLFGQYVLPEWLAVVLTVVWIAGVVNTFNWIDGLDGLAAGLAGIAALAFLVIALLKPGLPNDLLTITICAVLIGSIAGFLPYNFHPARIFIGDGGAFTLGYMLAIVSILGLFKQAALIGFVLPVAILVLPLADTVFAIVRRLWRGRPVTQADNKHIHHRLLALLSRTYRERLPEGQRDLIRENLVVARAHRNTVLALYLFTAVFAGAAVYFGVTS